MHGATVYSSRHVCPGLCGLDADVEEDGAGDVVVFVAVAGMELEGMPVLALRLCNVTPR